MTEPKALATGTAAPSRRRTEILDTAERLARRGGYHGFSFRDVATEVGVKSASVHYHFPTKADLTTALAERYSERFMASLGPAQEKGAVLRLIGGYRTALQVEDQMCLCGLFGAERDTLPDPLRVAVGRFFAAQVDWATEALAPEADRTGAETLVAGLEGAVLVARAIGDVEMFDRIAQRMLAAARGGGIAQPTG
ncbi:MAG: TetR/AcrR family transcriptional regulator [Paracoccaceae bacterium]